MPTLGERIQKAWNAFRNKDPTPPQNTFLYGGTSYYRPDRRRPSMGSERSIIAPILNRIAVDAAQVDIDAVTQGKVFGCSNSGSVYGDINVGGVAGAMAIEQALDPEGDLQVGVSSTIRTE